MEDPTITEILPSFAMVYHLAADRLVKEEDIDQQIQTIMKESWYVEEEKKLKADISKGRLKSDSLSYFVMTINMKSSKSCGIGTAANRRLLLKIILRSFPCPIIMCQETWGNIRKFLEDLGGRKSRQTGNEAAVIWDGDVFEGTDEGLLPSDPAMIQTRDELQKNGFHVSEVLSRTKMVKLTRRQTEEEVPDEVHQTFLAVSWHGPKNNVNYDKRKLVFEGLQEFVKKVCQGMDNIPFVIGGDFNLNIVTDKAVPVMNEIVIPRYELSPRAEESVSKKVKNYIPYKDNFVLSKEGIEVKWVRSFDFTSRSDQTRASCDLAEEEQAEVEDINLTSGMVNDLLDHDPVLGVIQLLRRPNQVFKNLAKTFEELSVFDQQ